MNIKKIERKKTEMLYSCKPVTPKFKLIKWKNAH